jgi:hypothetical protein
MAGELSGPVVNNTIAGWSTRSAFLSIVTHGEWPPPDVSRPRLDVLKVSDASVREATGNQPDIGDSSEILQTVPTVINRTYEISFHVWTDSTAPTAWWHTDFCTNKDVNGILIVRNTVEDDYTHPEHFEAIFCPDPDSIGKWQEVKGTYTATSNLTTFALHSEGLHAAWFDKIEVIDPYDRDPSSRNHPTTGSASITVFGSGFAGADATVMTRKSGTAAEATLWISDTACMSQFTAGVMATHYAALSIEGWINTLTEAASYDVPQPLPHITNRATLSPLVVTSVGSQFGTHDATHRERFGSTAVEKSNWVSDSTLKWCCVRAC